MEKHLFPIENGREVEIEVKHTPDSVVVSQAIIENGVRPLTKTRTVTCYGGGSAKSYTWTCPDNKSFEGDCTNPSSPTGRCY